MRSSKHAPTESSKSTSKHLLTLHQRLHHALSLGTRIHNGKESKWQSADIEIQRHVVRSIASFLDCLSGDNRHNPLVKDSLADIVAALAWILKNRSKAVLGIATNVVVNLIKIVPNTMLQRYTLSLVHPLASLLPSVQVEVSISCATALNMIISNLSVKKENEVWAILFETQTVSCIISGITEFYDGAVPVEYFREMTSLLSAILYRWPPSRYPAWNDAKLLEVMQVIRGNPDFSVKVSVLNLYCALALCGNGAKKLLENGEALLHMMALCMGKSYPLSVRTAGFRLAQCFAHIFSALGSARLPNMATRCC